MDKNKLIDDIEATFDHLVKLISSFDGQQYNKLPFEGSWTAGEVIEHITLADAGFVRVLSDKVRPADRAYDKLVPVIRDIMLNFDTKLKSPDFIIPERKAYDMEIHLATARQIGKDVVKVIHDLPLDQICITFELPNLGQLTRFEAVHFVLYHTQRHNHQLENIAKFLTSDTVIT